MFSTRYVLLFSIAMTTIVALGLTTLREVTKEQADLNEAIFNKRSVLKAVASHLNSDVEVDDIPDEEILKIFDEKVKQDALNAKGEIVGKDEIVASGYKKGKAEDIDMAKERKKDPADMIFPLYTYNNNGKDFYILSVRGKGLWDDIWGCVALEDDLTTVAGASFDHKGETPGLGAEIKDNPVFSKQFEGKKIFNAAGDYTSVYVRKGGAKDKTYQVDGISGATVTADGVTEMLYRGIQKYQPYFDSLKK